MSKVSVLIPLYNNEKDVLTAINSIIKQTYTNWEIICIDDFSTDNGYKVVEDFKNQNPKYDIKLIKNNKNCGVYVSLNIGINKSTGKYICRLDSDDTLDSNTLKKCVNILDNNPNYDIIHYKMKRDTHIKFGEISIFYRKSVIAKIGYYDSVRFAADSEFSERVMKVFGKKIYKINEIFYFATTRQNSLTTSKDTGNKDIRFKYRESFMDFHKKTTNLYIPFPMKTRPFPCHAIMNP